MIRAKNRNTTLLIALALPLMMIIFIAGSIFIPGIFSHPTYDFVYGIYDNSGLQPAYTVVNGKLIDNSSAMNPVGVESPQINCLGSGCTDVQQNPQVRYAYTQLYKYTTATKKNTALTPLQAQQLKFDANASSPDGYTIQEGSMNDGGLFFGGSYDNGLNEYIVGHNVSSKIDYTTTTAIPNANFYLVGWIIH